MTVWKFNLFPCSWDMTSTQKRFPKQVPTVDVRDLLQSLSSLSNSSLFPFVLNLECLPLLNDLASGKTNAGANSFLEPVVELLGNMLDLSLAQTSIAVPHHHRRIERGPFDEPGSLSVGATDEPGPRLETGRPVALRSSEMNDDFLNTW